MGGLKSSFADTELVYKEEIHKPIHKKKGITILHPPETNEGKVKHSYTGIAQIEKEGGNIVKVYPSLDDIPAQIKKSVHNSCKNKKMMDIQGYYYSYIKDL